MVSFVLASRGGVHGPGINMLGFHFLFGAVISTVLLFLVIVLTEWVFASVFLSGKSLWTVPALVSLGFLHMKRGVVSPVVRNGWKWSFAAFTGKWFLHYCIRFKPLGNFVLSLVIQHSSVLSRTLTLSVVWATMVAFTLFVVWLLEMKWRETGLTSFFCLMSIKCPRSRSLNVFPDCPTYWSPHCLQLMM